MTEPSAEHDSSFSVSHPGWKRKLIFVWGGEFASVLTSSILQMGLVWHVTLSTQSASALSLVMMSAFLPMALLGAFAGTIVDRISIKRAMIGADLFIAAVSLALVFVAAAGEVPVWAVVAVCFLRALGTTLHTPAFNALTPFVAPPELLPRLAGVSQFMQSGGYILGTAVAAVVYPLWGLAFMVALDVAGTLLATAAVVLSRIDTTVSPAAAAGAAEAGGGEDAGGEVAGAPSAAASSARAVVRAFFDETAEGYRALRRERGLFAMLWIGFAFTVAFSPVAALFPLMTIGHFGGTTTEAAAAEIVFSVGMVAASAAIGATGGFKNRGFSCALATALFGVASFASGLLPAGLFAVFLVLAFAMGATSALYSSPMMSLVQERIAPECLGRVFGLYGAVSSWAMPIGLVATTLFADMVGVAVCFAVSGAAMAALGVLTWALPSVRRIEQAGGRAS